MRVGRDGSGGTPPAVASPRPQQRPPHVQSPLAAGGAPPPPSPHRKSARPQASGAGAGLGAASRSEDTRSYRTTLLARGSRASQLVSTSLRLQCVLALLVASFVEMLASIPYAGQTAVTATPVRDTSLGSVVFFSEPAKGNYALCVGVISTALALAYLALHTFAHPLLSKPFATLMGERLELSFETLAAWFLVLWWGIGAGVATFQGPHLATGNGYFSCWVALVASLRLMNDTMHNAPAEMLARRTGAIGPCDNACKCRISRHHT